MQQDEEKKKKTSTSSSSSPRVLPPPPLKSRLVLKSGTLLIKAGLLRSWKSHHSVLTADGYLHIFDPATLLEQGKGKKITPPTFEPTLTIDVIASIAKGTPEAHLASFDVTTNVKGFLGLMNSTRTQSFRTEREDLVGSWVEAFGRIRRLIANEIV